MSLLARTRSSRAILFWDRFIWGACRMHNSLCHPVPLTSAQDDTRCQFIVTVVLKSARFESHCQLCCLGLLINFQPIQCWHNSPRPAKEHVCRPSDGTTQSSSITSFPEYQLSGRQTSLCTRAYVQCGSCHSDTSNLVPSIEHSACFTLTA